MITRRNLLLSAAALAAIRPLGAGVAFAEGTTLRFGPQLDPGTLDTLTNVYDYPFPPFSTVYEGLTSYMPGSEWKPVNRLAETLELAADGKSISFKLKEGIQFHRGFGELTAEDVKYSFDRATGKVKLYPGAAEGDVSYYGGDFGSYKEVQVTGKYTGVIVFEKPFAPMLRLTLPYATSGLIVSKKAMEALGKEGWLKAPVGTGPYEVVSYTPNKELIMKRFADYGGAAGQDAKSWPWDEIKVSLVNSSSAPTGAALTAGVESGDFDFTYNASPLDALRLQNNPAVKAYIVQQPMSYNFLQLNVLHPKLANPKVREAIRYLIDVPALIQAQDLDVATRLNALIAPQMGVGYWPEAPLYERDIEKAKALLAEAGVSALELDLSAPSGGSATAATVMQVIQANLAEGGIKVNVLLTPPDTYIKDKAVGQLSWSNYGGAPDPFYQFEWFTCDQFSQWNWAFACNADYDKLHEELAAERDEAKRTEIAIQMQKLMDASLGYIWVNHQVACAVTAANVEASFDPNGNPYLQYFKKV